MAEQLKRGHNAILLLVVISNVFIIWGIVSGDWQLPESMVALKEKMHICLPITLMLIVAGALNSFLPPHFKAQLVFLRWSHPLPGCRSFSKYMHEDKRIDSNAIYEKIGQFPTLPSDQNRQWYKLYKLNENEPSVLQSHKYYLLYRDLTAIVFLLTFPATYMMFPSDITHYDKFFIYAFIVLQFLVFGLAARINAVSLIKNVLASFSGK
jgi:hypothetical protein